jgi:hypothetical protein
MPKETQYTTDEDWEMAQAALEATRQLPAGAERFEALKKAGQLRYELTRKGMSEADGGSTDIQLLSLH